MSDITSLASAELASSRQHRARSAEVLLKLARENNLQSPGMWGWNELASVPHWAFLEADRLLHAQRVAGAVFLSPQIARCLDGRVLSAIDSTIGSSLLQTLLSEIDANNKQQGDSVRDDAPTADDGNTRAWPGAQSSEFADHSPLYFPSAEVDQINTEVENLLRTSGSAVLMATVAEDMPADIFATLLGPVAGTLPRSVALKVIEQAMRLIDEASDEVTVPEVQDQPVVETA